MVRSIVVLCLVVACASAGWVPRTKKRYDPNAGKFLIDVSLQSRNALYFPELFEYLKNLTRDEEAPIRQHGLPTDRRKRTQLLEMLRTHRDIYPLFNKTDKIYRIMDERKALMGPEANKFFDMVFKKAVDLHYNYVASYKLAWTVVDDCAKSVADKYKELSPEAQLDLQYQFPEMKKALEGIAGITVRTTTPSTAAPTTTTTIAPPSTSTTTKAPASTTPRAVPASTTTVVPLQPTSRPITVNTGAQHTTGTPRTPSPTSSPIVPTSAPAVPEKYKPEFSQDFVQIMKITVDSGLFDYVNLTNSKEYKNKYEFIDALMTASYDLYNKFLKYETFLEKIDSLEDEAKEFIRGFFKSHPVIVADLVLDTLEEHEKIDQAVQTYGNKYKQLSVESKEEIQTHFGLLHLLFSNQ